MVMSTAFVGSSHSYPQHPNNCNDDNITWQFAADTTDGWDATTRGYARDAINAIDDALDYDGTKLITVTETAPNAEVVVIREDRGDNIYASASCASGTIRINSNDDAFDSASFIYQVIRHEMFHLAGAEHAGQFDSLDGRVPTTMATCLDEEGFLSTNLLTRDDHQYENWLHSSLAERQLHANVGYEQGVSFWQKSVSSAGFVAIPSGGATGPGYVEWDERDISEYLFQTTKVIVGDDDEQYRVRINAKSRAPEFSTVIGGALYARTADLPNHPDNPADCPWPDGIVNANGPTFGGTFIKIAEIPLQLAGTSWTAVTSSWANPATFEAYEFQVRFSGNSQNVPTGEYAEVHVDNVRGEGT